LCAGGYRWTRCDESAGIQRPVVLRAVYVCKVTSAVVAGCVKSTVSRHNSNYRVI